MSHFSSLKHCRFSLGTRGNVDKYIKQFTEIFTEEGRRAVKITHQVIGQRPVITHTHPPSTTSSAASAQSGVDSAQAQSIITQATNLTTSLSGQVCTKYKINCIWCTKYVCEWNNIWPVSLACPWRLIFITFSDRVKVSKVNQQSILHNVSWYITGRTRRWQ